MKLNLRESQASDLPFLSEMLYEAVFWRPRADRPSLEDGLAYPEVAQSLADWGRRAGDTAVVAAVGSQPVGAAWYRFWTNDNHIRGYVDETTPVLVIGVQRGYRRHGIGKAMIEWLIARATVRGIPCISLAVSKDNYALRLYQQSGFIHHEDVGDSLLMVHPLGI